MGNAGRTVYCFDEWIYGNHPYFFEQPSYISDFPNQVGHWQDLVGTAEKRMILLVYGSQTRSKGQTSNLSLSILMHANNLQEILN